MYLVFKLLAIIFVHVNFFFRHEGSIQPDSLKILLEYTLARGNLTSIFKVLKLLYGKRHKYFFSFLVFLISFRNLP